MAFQKLGLFSNGIFWYLHQMQAMLLNKEGFCPACVLLYYYLHQCAPEPGFVTVTDLKFHALQCSAHWLLSQ